MGSPGAPSYADIFLSSVECNHIMKGTWAEHVTMSLRYMDHVFVIWEGNDPELSAFECYINQIHPLLKFSATKSRQEVTFPDVKITKGAESLYTSLYTKATDRNNLLRRDSQHSIQPWNPQRPVSEGPQNLFR